MKQKPKKESEGKISYMEIPPHFIAAMAARMNANTKYPLFNYKLQMDIEGLLQLVDATERHLADLKCLLQNEPPVHNLTETPLDHLPAIANNAAMIFYQLSKYDFGNEEQDIHQQVQCRFYDSDYVINIFSYNNETNKKERESFIKECTGDLYNHVSNLFGENINVSCTDQEVLFDLKLGDGKHTIHSEYNMLDYEETVYNSTLNNENPLNWLLDEETAKEDNLVAALENNKELIISRFHNKNYITTIFLGGGETKIERETFVKEYSKSIVLQNYIVDVFKGSFINSVKNGLLKLEIVFENYSIESIYDIRNYGEISCNKNIYCA